MILMIHQVHGQPAEWGDRAGVPGVFTWHEHNFRAGLRQDLASLHKPGPGADWRLFGARPLTYPSRDGRVAFLSHSSILNWQGALNPYTPQQSGTEKKRMQFCVCVLVVVVGGGGLRCVGFETVYVFGGRGWGGGGGSNYWTFNPHIILKGKTKCTSHI